MPLSQVMRSFFKLIQDKKKNTICPKCYNNHKMDINVE